MTTLDDRPGAGSPETPASSTGAPASTAYTPADRYVVGARPVLLTGVQAIARLLVEQHARDLAAGKRTATLVSGYPGSPLGGVDKLLLGMPGLKDSHGVNLVPAVNEELGATAVWGSQTVPGEKNVDGVIGVWYGKGPGVDRSGDVFRHGNTYGAHPEGGVIVLAGDDPGAKSSTVPCTSEKTLASFGMPVLTPRNGAELVQFGIYGIALSRLSGCWVGVKVLADVADGVWTVDEDFQALEVVVPEVRYEGRPFTYQQRLLADPRASVAAEADLLGPRWAAVEAFVAANPINAIEVAPAKAWLGIVSTGLAYDATREALLALGLDEAGLEAAGIRLLRLGMPFPLQADIALELADGVEQVLVIEEKTSFVEAQLKDVLYDVDGAPRVLGKKDGAGKALIPFDGQITADRLEAPLRRVLGDRVALRDPRPQPRTQLSLLPVNRQPYFCSGCPHNRSTVVPEGSLAGGGIGCHVMVALSDREESAVTGFTQMGGEGVQWIGQQPFTSAPHLFQNLGDGTYSHSGSLAIQACVAAGVNITYKLLYNQVVAMTGAQHPEGQLSVAQLTKVFMAQGVKKVVVVTDEPKKHKRGSLAKGVTVRHRDELDAVQRELREIKGTTVLIYDQQCANEARRLRKRGKQEIRTTRVVIDEQTCEGCGDCGAKSNCLSVQPVPTELGRKTRIDQTSCNTDYSCLLGDCPSFLTVQVDPKQKKARKATPEAPDRGELATLPAEAGLFLTGIGGTGIVTVNQILATASLRSGVATTGLDQVGLSQKAGPVTSHLRLGGHGVSNRVLRAEADLLLGFDLLVAADDKNLALVAKDRTVAVVSTSTTPTGSQVEDPTVPAVDTAALLDKVRKRVKTLVPIDALGASEALFGSTAPANLLLVGAAYELGVLPMPARAIEEAVELNGVAVAANIAAFRWGRVAVADPAAFAAAVGPEKGKKAAARSALAERLLAASALDGETARVAAIRVDLLLAHSGEDAARRYLQVVERAWTAERALGEATDYSEAVARGVAHLMAYKDEYEVARLLTRPELLDEVRAEVPGATKLTYNLHPPALRQLGMKNKLHLGGGFRPVLKGMAAMKGLRGTRLDPFGRAHVRVVERELVTSHTALVERLTAGLTADGYATAVQAAAAAELVRGYEDVKLRNVDRYREALAALGL